MNRLTKFLLVALGVFLFGSCQKQKPLFTLLDPDQTGVTFENTIVESLELNILNLYYLYNGGGVSVGDFDNNGFTDLFFTGNMVENRLYLNQGGMQFKDVTQEAGVGALGKWSYGSSVVDINGDGLLDIYVCASISADPEERKNMLFINQGVDANGVPVFQDKAASYGLDSDNYSTHASFFDYDQDGDLDVLILTNSRVKGIPTVYKPKVNDGSSPITDELFRNNGDGTFTEVSTEAGVTYEGFGLGIATADINKDGKTDVYVGNDFLTNDLLYMNQGGNFVEQIDSSIKHQSRFSMGNDAADINNDGHVDIITLDMMPETNLRKKTVSIPNGYIVYINDKKYGYTHQYVRNMLQVNNGNMTFSEIGQLAGIHQTDWSWSPLFADFDNDGFKDLLITNGYPKDITDLDFSDFRMETSGYIDNEDLLEQIPSVKIPNYAYCNKGDLTFEDCSEAWGFTQPSFSNGAAFADLDNDGDLDYIVNNINDPAFIFENTLNERSESGNHYLRIRLKGPKENPSAFGAKVTLFQGDKQQYQEQSIYRGYVSTVEDILHFGLGDAKQADKLVVDWPGGRVTTLENVAANQVLSLNYEEASFGNTPMDSASDAMMIRINSILDIDFRHTEYDYIDYILQEGLPHKFSQYGPSLSVGDVNGDGLEDFFVGGSTGHQGSLFVQIEDGGFQKFSGGPDPEKQQEDMGSLLFDADGDGDNDLYIVSGSMEQEKGSPHYQDRLYFNDGKGTFTLRVEALPDLRASGSCVRGADYDADGDIDLFVGGRVSVADYPMPPRSYLLENDGRGNFKEVTAQVCPELAEIGMVTDALWTDYDGDHDPDLMLVGELMPIRLLENKEGKLEPAAQSGLEKVGFWNSLTSGDFDKDGDPDYVIGNLGANNFYCATDDTPVTVVAKDFDGNGSTDIILSCFFKAEDGSMQPFPVLAWQQLSRVSPLFRDRFSSYHEYGQITLDQLLTEEEREGAITIQVNHTETSYIENLGNGKFAIRPLPLAAQVAPVNGLLATDVNGDNELDILLVGNDYGNEVNIGQHDALIGLVLLGNGKGDFQPLRPTRSGFLVKGDAKALARLTNAGGQEIFLATQNRGSLEVFASKEENLRPVEVMAGEFKAILHYPDGKKQYVDVPYGSGFLSQSGRKLSLDPNVNRIEIYNFSGESREINLKEVLE